MYQSLAWQITIVLVLIVLVLFAVVVSQSQSKQEYGPIKDKSSRIRLISFSLLFALVAPLVGFSLTNLPYSAPGNRQGEPEIIDVTGGQWYWIFSSNETTVGTPVEFHVTSADVNHGFGLYDSSMKLVAQTQSMPGYTNVLHYTFTSPGTYQVLCMEYCGLAHHGMISEFIVRPETTGGAQ